MSVWGSAVGTLLALGIALAPRAAAGQTAVPPLVERDRNWETISNAFLVVGVSSVFITPRAYSEGTATPTPSWNARWHVSSIAPAAAMVGLTLLVELPIKDSLQSARPGCSLTETIVRFHGSNCETFGGPSTHAFASWGATGTGLGIFLVDTLKYSGGRFNLPAFLGQVALPFVASIAVSVGRGVDIDNDENTEGLVNPITLQPFESSGQVAAGAIHGFLGGLTLGVGYAMLRPPSCDDPNAVFCW